MIETESLSDTLVCNSALLWLIAKEDFVAFIHHESLNYCDSPIKWSVLAEQYLLLYFSLSYTAKNFQIVGSMLQAFLSPLPLLAACCKSCVQVSRLYLLSVSLCLAAL
jgi:hypothetical protein